MKKIFGVILCLILLTGCATSHLENGEESVVQFDEGGISAQELYEKLKKQNGVSALTVLIDTELLSRKYVSDSDEEEYIKQVVASMKDELGDNLDAYISTYYGVSNESELKEYVRLNYRRNKWYDEYALSLVNETQLNDYVESSLVGDMELSHILITSKASSTATDEEKEQADTEAYNQAMEVINRLNNGEKFEDLSKELNDDASVKDNGGYLGNDINDRSSYDANFLDAAIKLEVGKYSATPVKSQYGYHIIYKASQKDKPSLDDVKDEISSIIANDLRSADSNFTTTAILALREEYGLKITDSELKSSYEDLYN